MYKDACFPIKVLVFPIALVIWLVVMPLGFVYQGVIESFKDGRHFAGRDIN